jgi:hypothetical protein
MIPLPPRRSFLLVLAAGLLSTAVSPAAIQFQTIDMLAIGLGNASVSNIGPVTQSSFPYGTPSTLGGVPFLIGDSANQLWGSYFAPGGNGGDDVTQTFPMPVNDIYGFYTIANTYWGNPGGISSFYTFNFDDSSSYTVGLENGVDIRDFNKTTNTYANTINGTTTRRIYDDPLTIYQLDRQWIDLAAAGHGGKNLTSFTVTDTGAAGLSRVFLVGATAQTGGIGQVPEPSICALLAASLGALLVRRRRKEQ